VNTLAYLERETGRHAIIERLKKASRRFIQACPLEHIPEVGSNLVEALPVAQGPEEVAGFPARIVKTKHGILVPLGPEFGGSDHMARLVLAAMETLPDVRAAMNLAYSKELVQAMKDAGLRIERFDRSQIPREVEEIEGKTLPYLARRWAESGVGALDALFDEGDKGKEPMVRVLGPDASEVVEKVLRAIKKTGRSP
jgi:hydroxymethylpyrimidine/phosphomethylpyrimidine kinase